MTDNVIPFATRRQRELDEQVRRAMQHHPSAQHHEDEDTCRCDAIMPCPVHDKGEDDGAR